MTTNNCIDEYFKAKINLYETYDLSGGTYIEDGRDRDWKICGDTLYWEPLDDEDWNYSSDIRRDVIQRFQRVTIVLVDDCCGDGDYYVILDNSKEIK